MMKNSISTASALAGAVALAGVLAAGIAQAAVRRQTGRNAPASRGWTATSMDTPMGSIWWPHAHLGGGRSGRLDQLVHETGGGDTGDCPSSKEGKTYKLGHEYHSGMPMFGERKWVIRIPASPTGGPFGGEPDRVARRVSRHRDRPGRDSVRRPRARRGPGGCRRRQGQHALLQRLHGAADAGRLRSRGSSAPRSCIPSWRGGSSSTSPLVNGQHGARHLREHGRS